MQKILVVDDEPTVRAFLEDTLRRGKFDVIQAPDGEHALSMVAAEKPDLILLDIRMPGMDGLELLRRLRASPSTKSLPVVFLTGTIPEVEELVDTLELDPSDFITKDASSRELVARVKWVLRRNPGK